MEKNDVIDLHLLTYHQNGSKIYKDTTSQVTNQTPSLWFSKRFLVATVLFICFVNFQVLRNNINIIVIEMTSNRTCTEGNSTVVKPPDFYWDQRTIALIISILGYGGIFSVFGDVAVNKFGGSVTCAWCMLIGGIITILHPAILYIDFSLFLAFRFLTGIFEMFFYVSVSDIFSRWFPKKERSTLISYSFNGTNVGVAGVYPFCGYLAYKWGWQVAFYITGIISVLSSILCLILVKNQPSEDKWISKKELAYILEETDRSTNKMKVNHPYRNILISGPVWSLCIVTFVFMWVASVLNACLPLYIKDLTQKETDEIGYISSIPNIVFFFLFPINGVLMDYWKNHSNITVTRVHKIILSIAFLFASAMFIVSALISNVNATLTFFVLIQIPMSFLPIILQVLSVNLAPDHASVLAGMFSCALSLSAIAAPTITGFMTTHHTEQEWNNSFYLAAAISVFGGIVFGLWGSSELQPWASKPYAREKYALHETN